MVETVNPEAVNPTQQLSSKRARPRTSAAPSDENVLATGGCASVGVPQKRRKTDFSEKLVEQGVKPLSKVLGSNDIL